MNGPILDSLLDVLQFQNILATVTGVLFGLFVGSTPGLTISLGLVLLLPLTFNMPAVTAVCLLLGLYASGMTGGSMSAILLNIPGTPSACATAIDGYEMTRRGRAGEALGIAVVASFFGGMFGLLCLTGASPIIARFALKFGAPELFALVLLGLTLICSFGQGSVVKGLISGVLGLIIMTVGLDPMMGTPRFTFGIVDLQAGISFLPVMIGMFAIPQVLTGIAGGIQVIPRFESKVSAVLPGLKRSVKLFKTMLLGSVIGTGVGAIPGAGGPIAVFLGYDYARKTSKKSRNFGNGEPEGIAAPEAANNAVAGGALMPMLTLGIPGDPITAILLGGLIIQGLIPGPMLFIQNAQFVYSIFWAYLLANLVNLILTLSTIKLWVNVLRVPQRVLLPTIFALCLVGTFALRNSFFDTGVMLFFGLLAHIMKKFGFPLVPMLLAIILGPQLEEHLRMALIIGQGNPTIFLQHPISLVFIFLAVMSFTLPLVRPVLSRPYAAENPRADERSQDRT
jgi:putative tricarboxylic transport membrane protein